MRRNLSELVIELLVVPGVLGLVALGFVAVCLRYLFRGEYALFWAEEVIRYGFIWIFWLASPLIVRRGVAFGVDLLTQHLSPAAHRMVALLGNLGVAALLLVYVWQGLVMARLNWTQLSTALEIRMTWVYLAIPVGAIGMFMEVALQSGRLLRGTATDAPEETRP
jgi:TRAP-type C4-dicarboxylate transport system permease small subunit